MLAFTSIPTTATYTLSLHDALPISLHNAAEQGRLSTVKLLLDSAAFVNAVSKGDNTPLLWAASEGSTCWIDRKSTRLNSSHMSISYVVFCLKNIICHPSDQLAAGPR